jgi:hypothetical protein
LSGALVAFWSAGLEAFFVAAGALAGRAGFWGSAAGAAGAAGASRTAVLVSDIGLLLLFVLLAFGRNTRPYAPPTTCRWDVGGLGR